MAEASPTSLPLSSRSRRLRRRLLSALGLGAAGVPAWSLGRAAAAPAPAPLLPSAAHWARLPAHPRLFASAAQLEGIGTRTDTVSRQFRALLFSEAERLLGQAPPDYPSTGMLMAPMRQVQQRVLVWSLAYRLGGDERFLASARTDLLALAALPEWRPSHFLGVGEAALAAGIGYDWLYAALSPDERDRIGQAIVRNALVPSLAVTGGGDSWLDGDFNWTQVCHAGLVVGALAIAEREPALAPRVVERALRNMGKVGASYAPVGAHPEGPSYWSYGTSFHVILIEALRSGLGEAFGMDRFPGFLRSAEYRRQMVGPTGQDFNYSDYHDEAHNEPVMLWFARELADRSVAREELHDLARALENTPGGRAGRTGKDVQLSRHLPLELLWWEPTFPAGSGTRQLHWRAGGLLPMAVMRSAWDQRRASFIAVKGGTPHHSHAHMDVGSFVLEALGVRWAIDLGTESYDKKRAAKLDLWSYRQHSTRWSTFRVGPEGHNILRFDGAGQQVDGKAEVEPLPTSNGAMANRVALTSLYSNRMSMVARIVRLQADGSMQIVDDWTARDGAVGASWQWLTHARISRTAEGLLLEQDGASLRLRLSLTGIARTAMRIAIEDVQQPRAPQDSANPGVSRIVITLATPALTRVQLQVHAIPVAA
jgi:hypothetical protein